MILFNITSYGSTSAEELRKQIPGVQCYAHMVKSPDNAAWLVDAALQSADASFTVMVGGKGKKSTSVDAIRNTEIEFPPLELKADLWSSFMMPHQQRGVESTIHKAGSLLLWAPGCITGDAEIVVNRGGNAKRFSLERLVNSFLGGEYVGLNGRKYTWDLSTVTNIQCMMPDGSIRLNKLIGAVQSGKKEVYKITTEDGREIKATLDHKFWSEVGLCEPTWNTLESLVVGDRVYVEHWPKQGDTPKPPKTIDVELDGLNRHPHARKKHRAVPCKIVSIEYVGVEETYDLQMEDPHNNFIANGFVVHNSGKSLPAMIWALCTPGGDKDRCLWITRAITKSPHLDQIHKYTTVDGQILEGEEPTVLTVKVYRKASTRRLAHGAICVIDGDESTACAVNNLGEYSLKSTDVVTGARVLHVDYTDGAEQKHIGIPIRLQLDHHIEIVIDFEAAQALSSLRIKPHIDLSKRFTIINWEILTGWWPLLVSSGFKAVVFDEIHRSGGAKRWVATHDTAKGKTKFAPKDNTAFAAMKISQAIPRRLGLTGTVIRNKPNNVWAPLDLVCPKEFGSRGQFMTRYASRHTGVFGEVNDGGASNLEELHKRMSFVVHRVSASESHKHLPPLRRETIYIPSSQLVDVADVKAATKLAGNSLLEHKIFQAAARKRPFVIESVKEAIENQQHCVVFTGRRADAEDIYTKCCRFGKKRGNESLILMAHGGIPVGVREATRRAYMAYPGSAILIATGDSMGEGVDLQNTDVALIAQLPTTPSALDQWEHRFFRLGGLRNVVIKYLIATGTVDEHIASMLLSKLPAVEKLQGGGDTEGMTRALMGGKSDSEIQSDLVSMLLGGSSIPDAVLVDAVDEIL